MLNQEDFLQIKILLNKINTDKRKIKINKSKNI
jgi:hypothetical protein